MGKETSLVVWYQTRFPLDEFKLVHGPLYARPDLLVEIVRRRLPDPHGRLTDVVVAEARDRDHAPAVEALAA